MHQKFNTVMKETDDRTVCMMIDKPISPEGYKENFMPRVLDMLKRNGEIRVLVYYKEFKGWEEEATKFDSEALVQYGQYVKKLAFVNPPEKEIFHKKMTKPLIKGDIRFFAEADLQEALDWVKD